MELKRILAKDIKAANDKAVALYGPDVLVISSARVRGQTELIVAVDIPELNAEQALAEQIEITPKKYERRIDATVSNLQGAYWLGDTLSVLDAYAITLLRWGSIAGIDPESMPGYYAYMQRVAAAAPVAAAIERERLQLNMYRKA